MKIEGTVFFNSYYYTGAPVAGTPILGTHYIVSCDAEVCGAERESSRTIQGCTRDVCTERSISPCFVSLVARPLAKTLTTLW